jgi:outer membrane receptor protein involved in Fe transport
VTAWLYSLYLQDEWRPIAPLTLNYGLRWDLSDAFVRGGNVGPRVGAIYQFATGTVLHAGYAKYFTPPPSELISTADIEKFAGTTGALPSTGNTAVRADKSDYFDLGIGQQVGPHLNLGVDSYFKYSQHILDEGQFGTALIFSPFNYLRGRVYGVEATAAYSDEHLTGYANFAYSVAQGTKVESGQFNFDPDELEYINNHYVFLDHDQTFTASAGLNYRWQGWSGGFDGLYGSGLRSGFANTGNLPYYIQINAGIKKAFEVPNLGLVELRVDCVNLFDRTYLIRDGSGIGVGAPQYGPRRAVLAGIHIPIPFTEPPARAAM